MTGSIAASPDTATLHADQEHSGIQFTVPLIILAAGILTFALIDRLVLLPLLGGGHWSDLRPFFRIVLSIVLGVAAGAVAEPVLKGRWRSGRWLRLDPTGLTAQDKDGPAMRIDWDRRVNVLRWRYIMQGFPRGGRERRVPTGHLLLACRLLQDNQSVVAYAFLPPKQAETRLRLNAFVAIEMAVLYSGGLLGRFSRPERPRIPSNLLSGQQGQIWAAEKERWLAGFELVPSDFLALTNAVERHVLSGRREAGT